jgi:hypothetical protein
MGLLFFSFEDRFAGFVVSTTEILSYGINISWLESGFRNYCKFRSTLVGSYPGSMTG